MNFSFFLDVLKELSIIVVLILLAYFIIQYGNKYISKEKGLHMSKKRISGIALLAFFLLLLYLVIVISGLRSILFTIIVSVALAYIINPLINFLEDKKIKRVFGILLVYVGIIGLMYLISVLIVPAIFNEVKELVVSIPQYSDDIRDFANDIYNNYYKSIDDLPFGLDKIDDTIENNLSNIQDLIIDAASGSLNFLVNFFSRALNIVLIPIIVFYLVKDKDYFKKNVILTIPNKNRTSILRLSREIDDSLGNFIRGQIIIAVFVGSMTAIGLLILNVNYAFTIGLIAGVTNVIPYFGAIIGGAIGMFFAFLDTPIKALWVLILFIVVNQIEGNFLQPKIMGDKVGLHPVIIIIALLIAGNLFGIIGLLIAVPIATTVKIIFSHIIGKISRM